MWQFAEKRTYSVIYKTCYTFMSERLSKGKSPPPPPFCKRRTEMLYFTLECLRAQNKLGSISRIDESGAH